MQKLRIKSLEAILQNPDWSLVDDRYLRYKTNYRYDINDDFLNKVYNVKHYTPNENNCKKLKYSISLYLINEDLVEEIWEE
jgi:hypothetical protein